VSVDRIGAEGLPDYLNLPIGTTVTMTGPPAALALSTSYLAHFAGSETSPFFIMSTGIATDVMLPDIGQDQGYDYDPILFEDGDKLTIAFSMPKPVNAAALTFDFTFLSEEYPEYVGDAYNDYFSVKVNGVEVAVDLNNKQISVNNNFFTSQFKPTGTFFDGQTPPLRIGVPIDPNASSVNVVFEIADVEDGIYDSAAFIKDVRFIEPQYVFVDFSESNILFQSVLGSGVGFDMPASAIGQAGRQQIIDSLNNVYKDFLIEFHLTAPTGLRSYSTVHVGGARADLVGVFDTPGLLAGRAEHTDYGNQVRSDNAIVLSGELGENIDLVTQVIAHEVGHLVGLRHVGGETEMMYPFTGTGKFGISGEMALVERGPHGLTPIGGTQDTYSELVRNLGLRESSKLVVQESSLTPKTKYVSFTCDTTLPKLYDVRIVAATQDNEVLRIIEAGNIKGKSSFDLLLPLADTDKFVMIGKSAKNGKYDILFTPTGVTKFNIYKAGDIGLLKKLGIDVDDLAGETNALMKVGSKNKLTQVGTVETTVVDIGSLATGATPGPDKLNGADDKNDVLAGLAGNDSVSGFGGHDMLLGNDGNDTIRGGLGKDTLDGGKGDDLLTGGLKKDVIRGGAGNDTADYSDSNSLVVNLADPRKNTNFAKGDRFDSIENIFGSNAVLGDALTGNAGRNILVGGVGYDTLDGGAGNDSLDGGVDNDWLQGGAGKDTLEGGAGGDTLDGGEGFSDMASYHRATGAVTVNLGNPSGNKGEAAGDEYKGIENVYGSGYDDTLIGDERANQIFGSVGKDTIIAGGGKDFLGGGEDDDSLDAGAGNDTMIGQEGKDTMRGGSGMDVFMFANTGDADADIIEDFKPSDDTIVLVAGYFEGLAPGPLPPAAFRSNKTGQAEDADDRIIHDKATGKIYFDPDGTGAEPRQLIVTVEENLKGVTYEDFIVR
jgi:Ca2+-binding RTX toxin-like protein